MVPPKRGLGDIPNGGPKRDSPSMSSQRKDGPDSRAGGPSRTQNGSRSGFRTDTAISNNRPGSERTLQRWVPDNSDDLDGSLESTSTPPGQKWDQFSANERLFGCKSDYDENMYTTAIDRNHADYTQRYARADRLARDIMRSTPVTAHVAEERVMDFTGGDDQGGDEEDKYSGVKRQQDFPPLSSARDNKYTPPARRAPTSHSTVVGAPVDPAIISSQIKGGPRKQPVPTAKSEEQKTPPVNTKRSASAIAVAVPKTKTPEPKNVEKPVEAKSSDGKGTTSEPAKATSASVVPTAPAAPAVPSISATPTAPAVPVVPVVPVAPAAPATSAKSNSKPGTPTVSGTGSLRASGTTARASLSPSAKPAASTTSSSAANSPAPPSVTENVENALLKDFKDFATQQRLHAEKARQNKMKADAQSKIQELKKFSTTFKLSTPVPNDLISIIAKDPAKQKEIQAKALQNAEEIAKSKADANKTKSSGSSATSGKTQAVMSGTSTPSQSAPETAVTNSVSAAPASGAATGGVGDSSKTPAANVRPQGPVHGAHNAPVGMQGRHPNARGGYMQQSFRQQPQPYRGDRSGSQHMTQGGHNTGHLAERIRNSDLNQNRYNKNQPNHGQAHFAASGNPRAPPTGPANATDNYSRRMSGMPDSPHIKLNPTTHEFRPNPFASSFNPAAPSVTASPRAAMNQVPVDVSMNMPAANTGAMTMPSPQVVGVNLIRRKTQNVTADKCNILAHIKMIKPPQGRNWDENGGLRPSFDTPILWRQMQDEEKPDSTMHLKYAEYFERQTYTAASMATPIQGAVMPMGMPQMAHQHQLPLHMQHGHMGHRPGHNMPPPPMHAGAGGHHGAVPQVAYNGEDHHRMMPSSSAQSYASPRLTPALMYPQHVGMTPQSAYNQPVMPFVQNGPQINQFRGYTNNPGFMPPQSGPMMSMMPPQPFVNVPGNVMGGQQQMGMYPGGPQFMGPPANAAGGGAAPPQQMGGSNGYPSPSRPAAPMMGQQGSQQGQPMYGMSPSVQYQQPAFGPQHPGQGANPAAMRGGYNNPSTHQYGTSPQNMHSYGQTHRNGSGTYSGKNYQGHNHHGHQGPPPHHTGPGLSAGHQVRPVGNEGVEGAK